MRVFRFVQVVAFGSVLAPVSASADPQEAVFGYRPWLEGPGPIEIDVSALGKERVSTPVEQPDFWSLDEIADQASPDAPAAPGMLPPGWVQVGTVVVPEQVALGRPTADMEPTSAVEMIPGNKYPRKHTLFLNFGGGMLYYAPDNSAKNHSILAKPGVYPAYQGGEASALSIIQAVQAKVAPYGIRVLHDFRPSETVPYTMEMVGGSWTDTNIDSPAGGVAPGANCGARWQRHVVYTFTGGGGGNTNAVANTIAHEAGHSWGLDHSLNCNSVMSYCASGVATFVNQCSGLCEAQCQGLASCRSTHDMFCGEGSNQQNDHAELSWIFGGNEPDIEPPTVEILEPAGDIEVETGSSVPIRVFVDDDYGGFGWKVMVRKDGVLILDEVDFEKESIDKDFLVAYRLTNLEDGVYEFTIEAEDHFEHVSRDTVTVVVGSAPTGSTGDGGEGDEGDDGEDESGADGAVSGGGTDGGTSDDGVATGDEGGFDDDDSGCACSATPRGGGTAAPLVLLLAAGLLRRRKAG